MPAPPPLARPARARRRRRVLVLGLWLVLLWASAGARLAQDDEPPLPARARAVAMTAFDVDGTRPERSMRLVLYEWRPARPGPARPSIVLLHGSPGSGDNFNLLAPILADAGYVVLAPDLPGFGSSSRNCPSYSVRAHARALDAFLRHARVERAHVVGWSMGGGVALELADLDPSRIASITLLGSVGVQQAEGSGSHAFEKAKYLAGYGALVVAPELVPHFGLFGRTIDRHAFVRNFLDTDLRRMGPIMRSLRTPTLILHGRRDFLTPAWGAELHHQLIEPSTLVMLDATHFMPFLNPEQTAGHLLAFMERHDEEGVAPLRARVDLAPERGLVDGARAWSGRGVRALPWFALVSLLALAACARPELAGGLTALGAAFAGLDAGIAGTGLALGMLARSVLPWARGVRAAGGTTWAISPATLGQWCQEASRGRARLAIATRLQPWRRDEACLALGLAHGIDPWGALGILVGSCLWAGVALGAGLACAGSVLGPATRLLGLGGVVAAGAAAVLGVRAGVFACTWIGRQRVKGGLARWSHHEFWPSWLFYAPLAPAMTYFSVRDRGVMTFTCANPAISGGGGMIGESKIAILRALAGAGEIILSASEIPPGEVGTRVEVLRAAMRDNPRLGGYPIVLKPDQGYRGYAMHVARSEEDAAAYLARMDRSVIAQRFHPGPHEIGCMWVRDPRAPGRTGRVISVTRKEFPTLRGDGRRTIERLVYRHPRLRRQADVFLARFAGERLRVPAAGELVRMGQAGNHAQGALFRDGATLISDEFDALIDRVASAWRTDASASPAPGDNGLDFGRFDLRFEREEDLRTGRGVGVIEFNGTSAESTNLYDPSRSVFWAWGVLIRQWAHLYRLGARRRTQGVRPASVLALFRAWRAFHRDKPPMQVAD